jgi:ATP-dependent Clp protease ATP-binding subunit ClpA
MDYKQFRRCGCLLSSWSRFRSTVRANSAGRGPKSPPSWVSRSRRFIKSTVGAWAIREGVTEMFERLTEGSRAALVEAQEVARELGSTHIDVAHVLYGCAEGREETAGRPLRDCGITAASIRGRLPRNNESPEGHIDPEALRAIGIDFDEVRAAVEETFGYGALEAAPDRRAPIGKQYKPAFTPEAKRSVELAFRVALELHHKTIAPGHLLLSLLRLDNDFVVSTVEQSNNTVADLSAAVLMRLSAAA